MKTKCLYLVAFLLLLIFANNILKAQSINPKDWRNLKGYWKFQDTANLTKATVGNDLSLAGNHEYVKGAEHGDTAIRIAVGSYYICRHNISPNGGGDSVNRYTLLFDFKVLNLDRWHTFHQTDTTNLNDGECFIRPVGTQTPGAIGVGYTGYSNDRVVPGKWHRLVISVNLGHYYDYYLDGKLILKGDTDEIFVDQRFALTPKILFFADNNQEDDTIDVTAIAVFDTCLSSTDIAKLGAVDPCIYNPPQVNLGKDTTLCIYNGITYQAKKGYLKYQWSTGDTTSGVYVDRYDFNVGKNSLWLKVTDINNCSQADTVILTYTDEPNINLGVDREICMGSSIQLTAASDTSFSYLWTRVSTGDTLSFKQTLMVSDSDAYSVHVISPLGCIANDTISVFVNSLPQKPMIKVNGALAFCEGGSVQLEAPAGYKAYTWSDGENIRYDNVNASDTIRLKVTDSKGCVSPWSDSVIVVVYKNPSKPLINSNYPDSFCKGDSTILEAPMGYFKYAWSTKDSSFSIIVKDAGKYNVIVTDSNGCVSPVSDDMSIVVYSLPVKPVIVFPSYSYACYGDSVELKATSGYKEYHWNDEQTGMKRFAMNKGWYRLYVTDNNGCRSPWSDSVKVTIFENPAKPTVLVQGKTDFCAGDSVILKVPSGFKQYYWQDAKNDTLRIIKTKGSFYFYVEDINGCISPISDTVNITLYPKPDKPAITIWGNTDFCDGDSLLMEAPGGYASYYWSDNSHSGKIYVKTEGSWSVAVGDTNGCISEFSESVSTEILAVPVKPGINIIASDSLECNTIEYRYKWYLNGNEIPDTTKSILAPASGYYKVQSANLFCWSVFSDSLYYQPSGINIQTWSNTKLLLYPVPAGDELHVVLQNPEEQGEVYLSILDVFGRELIGFSSTVDEIAQGISISTHSLNKGCYVVRLISATHTFQSFIEKW